MLRPADDSGKSLAHRVSAAGYYAGSSILVQFMNKVIFGQVICCNFVEYVQQYQIYYDMQALFTTFQFQFPITVALAQMVVMVPVCYIVAKPRLEWATAKAVFPLAVVNILNVVFGLVGEARTHQLICSTPTLSPSSVFTIGVQTEALLFDAACPSASRAHDVAGTADLNVPMFIALRRFTLVCTIVLERSLMHKQHDRATLGAVALMIGGKPPLPVTSSGPICYLTAAFQSSPTVYYLRSSAMF